MQKTEFLSESWDKKKIILAVFIVICLALVGYGVKTYILPANNSSGTVDVSSGKVKGVNTQAVSDNNTVNSNTGSISLPSAQNIESGVAQNINNIKQEISTLNIADIASSSPQIQKIVNDIKALPEVPGQKAKDICQQICSGL